MKTAKALATAEGGIVDLHAHSGGLRLLVSKGRRPGAVWSVPAGQAAASEVALPTEAQPFAWTPTGTRGYVVAARGGLDRLTVVTLDPTGKLRCPKL